MDSVIWVANHWDSERRNSGMEIKWEGVTHMMETEHKEAEKLFQMKNKK